MPNNNHTAACFLRLDVLVDGQASSDVYEQLSESLQNLLQEALLETSFAKAQGVDLKGMTCLILGPIPTGAELVLSVTPDETWRPLLDHLSDLGSDLRK